MPLEQIDERYSNHHSLRESQHLFLKFGCCGASPWLWAGTVDPEPGVQRDPNWRLFPAPFDGVPVVDPLQPLIGATCPCCGYQTVTAGYHVCEICAWVYCGEQELPDRGIYYNGFSLRESQQYFAEWGAKQPAYRPYVRAPGPGDIRDPSWQPVQGPVDGPLPELSDRTCPVCGYQAFRCGGEICPICCWPYFRGHQDGEDPSKPNPVSIAQAQQNYQRLGAWRDHPWILSSVRPASSVDVRDPGWRPASDG